MRGERTDGDRGTAMGGGGDRDDGEIEIERENTVGSGGVERSLSPQVISDSEEEADCAGECAGKGANGLGVRGGAGGGAAGGGVQTRKISVIERTKDTEVCGQGRAALASVFVDDLQGSEGIDRADGAGGSGGGSGGEGHDDGGGGLVGGGGECIQRGESMASLLESWGISPVKDKYMAIWREEESAKEREGAGEEALVHKRQKLDAACHPHFTPPPEEEECRHSSSRGRGATRGGEGGGWAGACVSQVNGVEEGAEEGARREDEGEEEEGSEREGQGEEEMEVPEWLYLRGYISPFKCKGRRGTERGKDC